MICGFVTLRRKEVACKHCAYILREEDRHHIDSIEHNNCVLCLVDDKGPMTQEEIASYMGITKMRVCQIEHSAQKKLKKKISGKKLNSIR